MKDRRVLRHSSAGGKSGHSTLVGPLLPVPLAGARLGSYLEDLGQNLPLGRVLFLGLWAEPHLLAGCQQGEAGTLPPEAACTPFPYFL